ncbi:o-succinylbenzoate--CoA ligase [Kineosphaera limosa NBRC 100340]|uniref:O-succinylbenzoate--CoA ligase n=1 Tax=Kineosphaera limosa NBRC 100340 TaxID=1184609 RepID=K6VJR2_9MICO|nr:o-succinylbenzoate--CoA ligase [Kineosphaera limosa]GAB96458.1 o-succinylbenzoate--CoA ligase [Kineosphaera limosa NBRC 100340]
MSIVGLPLGADLRAALPALQVMLDGSGPLLLPFAEGAAAPDLLTSGDSSVGPASGVAVGTSGSTGSPKRAILPTAALRASAEATHQVLGGPGRWLLALPPEHIAGLQVILRSLLSGHDPALLAPGPFTAQRFTQAVADARAEAVAPRYVSLVPTQLGRLLDDPAGRGALATFDAVLVGGAATPAQLVERARDAGARIVRTYGMSETAGGCVYDGRPLPGVRVRLEAEDDGAGRIVLGGPTVAAGYLGLPSESPAAQAFSADGQGCWFRTDDLGELRDGVLTVRGRLDDVIVTGGLKVAAHVVAEALAAELPDLTSLVLGLPDDRWGQVVTAVVVATGPAADTVRATWPETLDRLRHRLPAHALPRRLEIVPELPLRGPGKPDLAALRSALNNAEEL